MKNKDRVQESVYRSILMEDRWITRTEVEVATEETRIQVVEMSHVGPRWCDSQPGPVCQVPPMWYLDQALAPVW